MTPSDRQSLLPFKYWPFDLVPPPGVQLVWADRAGLKADIVRLGRRLGRHEAVSLHLLWADFGAGKTHTLLYLKQEAERGSFGSLLALYSALPKGCTAFLDIYRAMVRAVSVEMLRDAYQKAMEGAGRERLESRLAATWPSLLHCFRAIAIGGEIQQGAALGWLRGEAGVPARVLQGMSIHGRIRSTDDAVLSLCGMVQLLNLAGHRRVLWMIDEFQRVEVLRAHQQDEINAGLHGFYNACGRGMSILLSFSFGVEENIRHFLNQELLSRVDPLRISIPKLEPGDGVTFLNDVVEFARDAAQSWPVSKEVVPAIVGALAGRFELTPRRLLKAAGLVFELAAMDLEDGRIQEVTDRYVEEMVVRGDFERIDEQENDG